ncbi:hypothetical protein LOK49_Contig561G00001 [Camellia lanceoleosa]|nr:hypothetical protein LOK49_Contig561G00001 [Camellia lanceoleosa]
MVETARDRPTASRKCNVVLSQKVAKRPQCTRKTKDQGSGVNEYDMNDIGAALAKTVEVENDGGNQLNHIDSALSISRLMLEIGYNEAAPTRDMLHNAMKKITQVLEESPTRDMLRNAMKKITQVLEGQHSTEEHTPLENLVYTRHRNRGATS